MPHAKVLIFSLYLHYLDRLLDTVNSNTTNHLLPFCPTAAPYDYSFSHIQVSARLTCFIYAHPGQAYGMLPMRKQCRYEIVLQ